MRQRADKRFVEHSQKSLCLWQNTARYGSPQNLQGDPWVNKFHKTVSILAILANATAYLGFLGKSEILRAEVQRVAAPRAVTLGVLLA